MQSNWKQSFNKVHRYIIKQAIMGTFPVELEYPESQWARWQKRIEQGQKEELASIVKITESWPKEEAGDWLEDEFYYANSVTDIMYAALIVSIWARMESFFKTLIKFTHPDLLKIPYQIKDIKKHFKDDLNIELETISEYETIDAIRILNNSFKHSNGKYKPKPTKPWDHINPTLLNQWNIKENENIEYAKLPVEDLVIACNAFTSELFARVEAKINNHALGSGGS